MIGRTFSNRPLAALCSTAVLNGSFLGALLLSNGSTLRADEPAGAAAAKQENAQAATRATSANDAINHALDSKVKLDFQETPLNEVVEFLKDSQGINVWFDSRPLSDSGIDPGIPVTLKIADVSLRSALRLMLGRVDLAFYVREGVLEITTPIIAASRLETRIYNVADLFVDDEHADESLAKLVELIPTVICPTSWDEVGGPGSLKVTHGALVVSQTRDPHRLIDSLLAALRQAAKKLDEDFSAEGMPTCWRQLRAILARPVDVDFEQTPLNEALDFLVEKYAVPLQLDARSLNDAGVPSDAPVSLRLKNVSLETALRLLSKPLDLDFWLAEELIHVGSSERGAAAMHTIVYPVADLMADAEEAGIAPEKAQESLRSIVETTVAPASWDNQGGPGAIVPIGFARSLVVSQSYDVHVQIIELLAQLRRAAQEQKAAGQDVSLMHVATPKLQTRVFRLVDKEDARSSGQEAIDLIKTLIEPQSWEAEENLIRLVGNNIVVHNEPAVIAKVYLLLRELGVLNAASPTSNGGTGIF